MTNETSLVNRSTAQLSLQEKIEAIYNSETNIRMESFFDSGWQFAIGDLCNGIKARKDFDTFPEGVNWLYDTIVGGMKSE